MVIIKKLEIKKRHKYVWLKYVNGFNLMLHCARCLKGTYCERINRDILSYSDIDLPPSPYYYFCAVNQYITNIHLAFVESPGENIIISDERYEIAIENARQIKFDDSRIDKNHPKAGIKEYNTCRNWQFANWVTYAERNNMTV